MAHKEHSPQITTLEKGLWWTQVGGAIGAVVGLINGWMGWAVTGGVLFVGSQWARDQISQTRQYPSGSGQ